MRYKYFVQKLEADGNAVVEYVHPEFGAHTRYMVLPIDRGEAEVRRKIVESFPKDHFYSCWLRSQEIKLPEQVQGEFEVDFGDYFYTITDAKTFTQV